jgi:dTDP-4-dehydrorhamnose 3,5-epimerase
MIVETKLAGAYVIHPERFDDERGFFARSWSVKEIPGEEFAHMVECNLSVSARKGTLRGMHYQDDPHQQAKMVRCTRGAVYDVIVDLRSESPTFKHWVGVELSAENRLTLCVPRRFAHGFLTLVDDTEIFYLVSDYYAPETYRGVRWDDPAFGIEWPETGEIIVNERDRSYPYFKL